MFSSIFKPVESGLGASASEEVRLALRAADIPSFRRSLQTVRAELRRSRRYEHPLSVLVAGVDGESLREAARRYSDNPGADVWFMRRFECTALLVLGWILRDQTREMDLVSYAAEHQLYAVVMPETDASGVQAAVRRLSAAFEERSSVALQAGFAVFPGDGFTIEDLFERARSAWSEQPVVSGLNGVEEMQRRASNG